MPHLLLNSGCFGPLNCIRKRHEKWMLTLGLMATLTLSGCGYNDFQTKDEAVKKSWAEVLNQYQRRSDLIPQSGCDRCRAGHTGKDVLLGVTEARSRVGSMKVDESVLNNPQAMQNFQKAQGELSSALSRLLVVSENYPQLKSDANFRELQSHWKARKTESPWRVNAIPRRSKAQHPDTPVPDQPDRDAIQLLGQAAVHGGEREGYLGRAEGGLWLPAPAPAPATK